MRDLAGKFRYAMRQFRLSPVFTVAAVLTLALGIGGTTAIFSLIHAVMLKSLPVSDPARLYRVGEGDDCCVEGGPQDVWGMVSFPLYERLKKELPEFEETTAFQAGRGRMSVRRQGVESTARPLRSEYVDGHYFTTLGVGAYVGRVFTPKDDQASAAPVIVLSHRAWQTIYAADPKVVGATFVVEGNPFTVIGVAPARFFGEMLESDPPDIWVPVQQEPMIRGEASLLRQPISAWLRVIGRLKLGATTEGMSARLTTTLRQWLQYDSGYPANWMPDVIRMLPKQVLNVVPAGAGVAVMKEEYGRSLQILLVVCGLVLLIACSNVANLLLARGVARRGQTAVRMAVGATAREIVTQALVESVLLAVGGGVVGWPVAMPAKKLLLRLATPKPTTPPPIASSTLSTSACVTISQAVAPTAIRTAVCPRRATPLASSRFATFEQAISSTSPHTTSKICRLLPYSSFITATPAPAGTTLSTCFGNIRITSGIQFAGYPESYCSHCRKVVVSRADIPSVVAPSFNLPMTRSHAEIGCRSRLASPRIIGSCCTGTQMSGGSLSSISPKNRAGATPITVNGLPSTTNVAPTTF